MDKERYIIHWRRDEDTGFMLHPWEATSRDGAIRAAAEMYVYGGCNDYIVENLRIIKVEDDVKLFDFVDQLEFSKSYKALIKEIEEIKRANIEKREKEEREREWKEYQRLKHRFEDQKTICTSPIGIDCLRHGPNRKCSWEE